MLSSGEATLATTYTGQLTVTVNPSALRDVHSKLPSLGGNDTIVAVNGETIQGLTLTDVVNRIKGPRGTTVKLSLPSKP